MESQSKHQRVPCKARSVPSNHTTENAYFDIPPNAEHGLTLVCSHPECALSGGRFKYCVVCKIPVSKRNFARRHSHGLLSRRGSSSYDHDPDLTIELIRHLCGPLPLPSIDGQKGGTEGESTSDDANAGVSVSLDLSARQGPPVCHDITPGTRKPKGGDWEETSTMLQDKKRKADEMCIHFQQDKPEASYSESWDARESRKRQHEQTTTGRNSTKKTNYKSSSETDHRAQSQPKDAGVTVMYLTAWEREWNSFLYSRPPSSDKRKMHEWMEKVLSHSECFAGEDSDDDSLDEEHQVTRTESKPRHPPSSAPIIESTFFDDEAKPGMSSTAAPSQSTFSANVASLPLPDDEQRISAPKAA